MFAFAMSYVPFCVRSYIKIFFYCMFGLCFVFVLDIQLIVFLSFLCVSVDRDASNDQPRPSSIYKRKKKQSDKITL